MKTSVTVSLLPSKPTMPFVLGPDLEQAVGLACEIGFDAFELFPPSLEVLDQQPIERLCRESGIQLSTVGTGGGAIAQGLTLIDPDADIRNRAVQYIEGILERAGEYGASGIIGSMQGRIGERDRASVMPMLRDQLGQLGSFANRWSRPLLLEPLNRYESDVFNTVGQTEQFLRENGIENVQILADLFHMNIEEVSIAESLRANANRIGHVHFVDSNRRAAGLGHTDLPGAAAVLKQMDYGGYLAVEAFPLPTQREAAEQAMSMFHRLGLKGDGD